MASLRLCVALLGLLVAPLSAEFNPNRHPQFKSNEISQFPPPNSQSSIYQQQPKQPVPATGFKTMLFRVLGIGGKESPKQFPNIPNGQTGFQIMTPNFGQGGPCGIPFSTTTTTTTQSPFGPCPFPNPYIPPGPTPTTPRYPDVTHPVPTKRPGDNSAQVTADPFDRFSSSSMRPPPPFPVDPFPEPSRVPPVGPYPIPEPSRVPPVPLYPVPEPSQVPPVGPYPIPEPSRVPPVPLYPVPEPSRVPPVGPYPIPEPSRVPPVGPSIPDRIKPVDPYPVNPYPIPNPTRFPPPQPTRPPLPTTTSPPRRPPPGPVQPNFNDVYARRLPCSALRPFVPHGFQYASIGNYAAHQCDMIHPNAVNPMLRNEPACSVLESLRLLGANKMRDLILISGMEPVFQRLSNYTLFVPLDVSFHRLPAWLLSSLDTDEKLRQAFILNHFVKKDVPLSSMGNEFLILNDRPGRHRIRTNIYFENTESPIYTADGARIVRGDILVENGRIHLTDKVIMPNPSRNAAEYLSEKQDFEAFWNIVKNTNLEIFQSDRPITVFIPLNAAIDTLDLKEIMAEPEKMSRFVNHHVVNGTYYSAGLINSKYLMTNYEREIKVGIASDSFSKYMTTINGHIRVIKSDIPFTNGVAHVIEEAFSHKKEFFLYDEGDEFEYEYGVISRRSMKVTGEEKFLDF